MTKLIDLTGQKFGKLTVIKRAENNKDGRSMWFCKCDCGKECIVRGKSLRNRHTRSCGCLAKELNSQRSLIDHTGERFGRLTVEFRVDDYVAPNSSTHVRWFCRCDCGNSTIVDICQLIQGKTKSCGCLQNERLKQGNIKHNGSYDRLYKVYSNMKNRCYNTNSADYKYYGDRGILICNEWLENYLAFKEWAYNNGYNPQAQKGECTIDRINVNGNYEPNNCRWVNMKIQNQNKRNVTNNIR